MRWLRPLAARAAVPCRGGLLDEDSHPNSKNTRQRRSLTHMGSRGEEAARAKGQARARDTRPNGLDDQGAQTQTFTKTSQSGHCMAWMGACPMLNACMANDRQPASQPVIKHPPRRCSASQSPHRRVNAFLEEAPRHPPSPPPPPPPPPPPLHPNPDPPALQQLARAAASDAHADATHGSGHQ